MMAYVITVSEGDLLYKPPYLTGMKNRDKKLLNFFWKIFGDAYIVDPVSGAQAYAIMYDRTPWILRKLFFRCRKIYV